MSSIRKGDLVVVTNGSFSDYSILSVQRAKEDFELSEVREEFLESLSPEENIYIANVFKFIRWLQNEKGLMEEIEFRELNLGEYGSLNPVVD